MHCAIAAVRDVQRPQAPLATTAAFIEGLDVGHQVDINAPGLGWVIGDVVERVANVRDGLLLNIEYIKNMRVHTVQLQAQGQPVKELAKVIAPVGACLRVLPRTSHRSTRGSKLS